MKQLSETERLQKTPAASNYTFDQTGVNAVIFNVSLQNLTKPNGYVEPMGLHVAPRSLYRTQLKKRLGTKAMKAVVKTAGRRQ